ncbi:MAG TPA: hypothetical protein VN822_07390 [Candidatus Acidoferrales bacterium]|nr:hypothetical protein [Candidatus Acidoferrales bacterium]
MREIKVYDEARVPRDWNALLKPSQCAIFFRRFGSETPVSSEGVAFARLRDSTFLLFDSLGEAQALCEARVQQVPDLCCEVFDCKGKAQPPLLVVVNAKNASKDEFSAASVRKRKIAAVALVLGALPLFWWDHRAGGSLVAPTYIGFTMILAAIRLFFWNRGRKEHAKEQDRRIEEHLLREKQEAGNAKSAH